MIKIEFIVPSGLFDILSGSEVRKIPQIEAESEDRKIDQSEKDYEVKEIARSRTEFKSRTEYEVWFIVPGIVRTGFADRVRAFTPDIVEPVQRFKAKDWL